MSDVLLQKKVLIVEDEAQMQNSLKLAFERSRNYGYEINIARGIEDLCEKKLDQKTYDVVVADLNLHELTTHQQTREPFAGFYATHRSDWPDALRVVYSAYYEPDLWAKAALVGASLYLHKKAITPAQLVDAIDLIFEQQDHRRQIDKEMRKVLEYHAWDWLTLYGGKCIAIVGEEVVAVAPTRVRVLWEYSKYYDTHPDAPKEPFVTEIMKKPTE